MKRPVFALILASAFFPWVSSFAQSPPFQEFIKAEPYELSVPMKRVKFEDGAVLQLNDKDEVGFRQQGQESAFGIATIVVKKPKNSQWFLFAEDYLSFVYCVERSSHALSSADSSPIALPAEGTVQLNVADHPEWKTLTVSPGEIVANDGDGKALAEFTTIRFTDRCLVCFDKQPEVSFGILAISQNGGSAIWCHSSTIGVGLRRDQAGAYRQIIRTKNSNASLDRHIQFGHLSLRAQRPVLARIGEQIASSVLSRKGNERARNAAYGWQDLAAIRSLAGDHGEAAGWYRKELEMLKTYFANGKEDLLACYVRLCNSLAKNGEFEEAKGYLVESMDLAKEVESKNWTFLHRQAIGDVTFGLKIYPSAAQIFDELATVAGEMNFKINEMDCMNRLATTQIAMGKTAEAKATLEKCIAIAAGDKNRFGDTHKIAFGLAAIGDLEEALKFAPASGNKNSVTYMEIARMAILFNLGRVDDSVRLARMFQGRLNEQVNLRADMDSIHVELIGAIANRSAESKARLGQAWALHGDTLRKRPLENWTAALVFSQTMAKL